MNNGNLIDVCRERQTENDSERSSVKLWNELYYIIAVDEISGQKCVYRPTHNLTQLKHRENYRRYSIAKNSLNVTIILPIRKYSKYYNQNLPLKRNENILQGFRPVSPHPQFFFCFFFFRNS